MNQIVQAKTLKPILDDLVKNKIAVFFIGYNHNFTQDDFVRISNVISHLRYPSQAIIYRELADAY